MSLLVDIVVVVWATGALSTAVITHGEMDTKRYTGELMWCLAWPLYVAYTVVQSGLKWWRQ